MVLIILNKLVQGIKMNEIVNNFLVAGGIFMPEMHLRPPNFTYSACKPYTKKQRKIIKI